jgi:hypothetical protein
LPNEPFDELLLERSRLKHLPPERCRKPAARNEAILKGSKAGLALRLLRRYFR